MERRSIYAALANLLEGELKRGISVWDDPAWNAAAAALLAGGGRPGGARTSDAAPPPSRARPSPPNAAAGSRAKPHAERGTAQMQAQTPEFGPPPEAQGRADDWEAQLAAVAREASTCVKCGLHETRQNVVFASGSGRVPLVLIGEGPGADEDATGEAFVGRAGQLLTKIIAAIGLDRKDVYICNIVKCRPPGNRNPLPDEAATCWPYLEQQLEILKPRAICTLGLVAAQYLLETKAPIGRLRGRIFRYRGIPVVPTYHPAFLLRSPGQKRVVWEDVKLLRKILDEGVAAARGEESEVPDQRPASKQRADSGNLFG